MTTGRSPCRGALTAAVVGALVPSLLIGLAAAGAGTVPPSTPVPPRGSLSPYPSSLQTPSDASVPPSIAAASAVLADLDTGQILFAKDGAVSRPIASLTKMMTALVVLDRAHPDDLVTVPFDAVFGRHEYGATSTLQLRAGERIRVRDLLYGMLLGSANDAAIALADHVAGDQPAFIRLMDRTAGALGMRHTRFDSVNGLDDRGRSTAFDTLRLARALYRIPLLARIVASKARDIRTNAGRVRHIQNRNALLWLYSGAIGAKTGTTAGAGECMVAVAARGDLRLVSVVLRSPHEPFSDAAAMLNYGFDAFELEQLVERGAPAGSLDVLGGSVPVVAGGDLTALVARSANVRTRAVADTAVAFPPARGDRVGTLRVRSGGAEIGAVPLLAGSAALPPPPSGPWWVRATGAVVSALSDAIRAFG